MVCVCVDVESVTEEAQCAAPNLSSRSFSLSEDQSQRGWSTSVSTSLHLQTGNDWCRCQSGETLELLWLWGHQEHIKNRPPALRDHGRDFWKEGQVKGSGTETLWLGKKKKGERNNGPDWAPASQTREDFRDGNRTRSSFHSFRNAAIEIMTKCVKHWVKIRFRSRRLSLRILPSSGSFPGGSRTPRLSVEVLLRCFGFFFFLGFFLFYFNLSGSDWKNSPNLWDSRLSPLSVCFLFLLLPVCIIDNKWIYFFIFCKSCSQLRRIICCNTL